jgi:hypothetical protein
MERKPRKVLMSKQRPRKSSLSATITLPPSGLVSSSRSNSIVATNRLSVTAPKIQFSKTQVNMDGEIKAQILQKQRKMNLLKPYDAKFCIAVIGNPYSGKEDILGIECDLTLKPLETRIQIVTKQYQIMGLTVQVEMWCCPESSEWVSYCAKAVAGLAGTILFFDGILFH